MLVLQKVIILLATFWSCCSDVVVSQNSLDTNTMPVATDLPRRRPHPRPIYEEIEPQLRPEQQPRVIDPTIVNSNNPDLHDNPFQRELFPLDVAQALPPELEMPNDSDLESFQSQLLTTVLPEVVTSPSCLSSRPDPKDKRFYYQRTIGLGWIRRRCPQGTGFHNLTCDCSVVVTNTNKGCQAEFYFNFERDAKDNSNNSLPVGDTNVKINDGAGEFTGLSKIIMWRYSGAEFRNGISARLSYKPIGEKYQKQALLTNCDSARTKPTIGIVLNKKNGGHELLMFVRLHGQREQLLIFPSKTNDWNDAIFSFDGKMLSGTVNGISKTTPAPGSLIKGSSGLVLGRCEYYNWFTGLMDEVYIYPCVPKNMVNPPQGRFPPAL